jgi:hypothetical protein
MPKLTPGRLWVRGVVHDSNYVKQNSCSFQLAPDQWSCSLSETFELSDFTVQACELEKACVASAGGVAASL